MTPAPASEEDLRAAATAELSAWTAPDAAQEALRTDYLAALTDPALLSRAGRPDHLTASAAVLDADGRRVLLTLHRRVRLWLQVGGHCEPGDPSLRGAAAREALEESGIPGLVVGARPLRLDRHGAPCGARHHLDVQFLARAPRDAVPQLSDESLDLAWFDLDDLPVDRGSGVDELVTAARAALARA